MESKITLININGNRVELVNPNTLMENKTIYLDELGAGAVINTPNIISPSNGTVNFTGEFQSSAYSTVDTFVGVHTSSYWQASTTSDFNLISEESTVGNLLSWSPSLSGALTTYYVRVKHISDDDTSNWSTPVSVTTPDVYVESPTLTVEGAPSNVPEGPLLEASAFNVINGTDTHTSTDWVIELGGTEVWSSLANTTNKTSISVPEGILQVNTTYTFKVKYNGLTYSSSWTSVSATTLSKYFFNPLTDDPVPMGDPYEGGYYAGKIDIDGTIYALIVAPKESGRNGDAKIQWKTSQTATSGTASRNDGWTNSNSMNNTTHPAAYYCRGLTIGGFSDWYLPAPDELELIYRNLKPNTTANYVNATSSIGGNPNGYNPSSVPIGAAYTSGDPAQTSISIFQEGGAQALIADSYWSSMEVSSTHSWYQNLYNGSQNQPNKVSSYYCAAVRKAPLN